MNHPEARALVLHQVRRLMTLKYAELLTFVDKETPTRARGASGVEYVIDIDVATLPNSRSSNPTSCNRF